MRSDYWLPIPSNECWVTFPNVDPEYCHFPREGTHLVPLEYSLTATCLRRPECSSVAPRFGSWHSRGICSTVLYHHAPLDVAVTRAFGWRKLSALLRAFCAGDKSSEGRIMLSTWVSIQRPLQVVLFGCYFPFCFWKRETELNAVLPTNIPSPASQLILNSPLKYSFQLYKWGLLVSKFGKFCVYSKSIYGLHMFLF